MKKEWILRLTFVLCGVAVGIAAALFVSIAKSPKQNSADINTAASENNVGYEKFEAGDLWDKIVYREENQAGVFYDNYYSIYGSGVYYCEIDLVLEPYFEKYGYDAVLISGLESEHIYIQSYCVEKCCELYGDERIKKPDKILEALNKINIDTEKKTNDGQENEFINIAVSRLELAVALYSGNYRASKELCINENGTRMCWYLNKLSYGAKYRVCDNGFYYNIDDLNMFGLSLEFVENDVVLINKEFSTVITGVAVFKEKTEIIIISDTMSEYIQNEYKADEYENTDEYYGYANIISARYSERKISGSCYIVGDKDDGRMHNFSIDVDTKKIIFE